MLDFQPMYPSECSFFVFAGSAPRLGSPALPLLRR
jgi:hypothetical protein